MKLGAQAEPFVIGEKTDRCARGSRFNLIHEAIGQKLVVNRERNRVSNPLFVSQNAKYSMFQVVSWFRK